jgi:imidazolonepropionase-like amidohydrolase
MRYVRWFTLAAFTLSLLNAAERGTLALYFLQLPVGEETYELADNVLRANFEYTERGSKIPLTATLRMQPDLAPLEFEAYGRNYRPFSVDAFFKLAVPIVEAGPPFFAISGYAPFSVQMMMLRYWLAHGKPARIERLPVEKIGQFPAATRDSDIIIERTGQDMIGGARLLTRYSIANVVWGRESVWLNDQQEIAAAVSYAGNLPIEAVRPEYRDALVQFIRSALADRIKELASLPVKPVAQGSFAIANARLIDGTGAESVGNATVIVRDGKIVAAGHGSEPGNVPRGVQVIDAHGATLLPGLWEMHAHFAQVEYGPAYLAAGVTTARDCGGEFEFITAARDLINHRGGIGPHLLLAGLVDGSGTGTFGTTWADTPEQGRAVVAKYKAAGFDQMKIYNRIKPEVLKAIADEAHRRGMTVTGHIPEGMTAVEAVEAGMDMINHFGPVTQTVRAMGLEKAVDFFKQHHTVIDPTFAWGELLSRPKNVEISSFEPGFAKAPYTLTSMIGTASGQGSRLEASFTILRALYAAGVPIVAGTDKALPAHSLHRELELYVQAGLTPMQVIQLATLGSARVMGLDREVGSIEAGKRADMILVDGNPLTDFSAMRRVTRVISNGRVYDPAQLWKGVGFQP